MEKEEEVQATYVLLYPYVLQNNKKVAFVAKHGSLFLATVFFTCMIFFHFNFIDDQTWILFLPLFVFYSLAYIFGHISSYKIFRLLQTFITTAILTPYSFCVCNFIISNNVFSFNWKALRLFFYCTMSLYAFMLHFSNRKLYVKDLSTPESVSTLNTLDCCQCLLFIVSIYVLVPLTDMLRISFSPNQSLPKFNFYWNIPPNILVLTFIVTYLISAVVGLYIFVTYSNSCKRMAALDQVQLDSQGRAWWSGNHRFDVAWLKLKLGCSILCCPALSIKRYQSSVQPEDSQKLPLKNPAKLDV